MTIAVRDYHVSDLPAVIDLHRKAFPEELSGTGLTIEEYIRWLRLSLRWAFGPLRLVARISHVRWAVLVAEVDGTVVGTMTFIGHRHIAEASSALVDPTYQRQGVASALGDEILRRIAAQQTFKHVRAIVMQTNTASLALCKRFGLEVYDCYTDYDIPLPLAYEPVEGITSRPRLSSDQAALEDLARRTMNPLRFEFDGVSPMPILVGRLYERLVGTKMLHRVYEQNGRLIGFMRAKVDRKSRKGVINRFILDDVPGLHDLMQQEAAAWITGEGKRMMRVTESGEVQATPAQDPIVWVRLAKRL